MPFGMSLAAEPLGTPVIYDPNAPAGQRWSNAGLDSSQIARLYHSSAILLPDASVLIAGSYVLLSLFLLLSSPHSKIETRTLMSISRRCTTRNTGRRFSTRLTLRPRQDLCRRASPRVFRTVAPRSISLFRRRATPALPTARPTTRQLFWSAPDGLLTP
jgi:hypothetical protein